MSPCADVGPGGLMSGGSGLALPRTRSTLSGRQKRQLQEKLEYVQDVVKSKKVGRVFCSARRRLPEQTSRSHRAGEPLPQSGGAAPTERGAVQED